jgi:hypothetical protein
MFQRRWILPGLVVALLFVVKRADEHRQMAGMQAERNVGIVARAIATEVDARTTEARSERSVEAAGARTVEVGRAAVTLPVEAAAITAEVIQLQQLAQDSGLELTSREWLAFAAVTREIQEIRQAYEASIAKATAAGQGKYHVEVPVYAVAGDALRAKFQAVLRTELGDANAEAILASMGRKLEGYFGGFGVSVQTLEIAGSPTSTDPNCVVTRTVQFWNSVEGGEQLATRRETHFPNREDPEGEMWQPFLELTAQVAGG